jgi:hypothetical protein
MLSEETTKRPFSRISNLRTKSDRAAEDLVIVRLKPQPLFLPIWFAQAVRLYFWFGGMPLDCLVDFAAMYRDLPRCFYPQPYLVSADFHDNDRNIVVDDDTFILLTG